MDGQAVGSYYKMGGTIENKGEQNTTYAWVIVTFYDPEGNIVEDAVDAIGPFKSNSAEPGAKQSFSVVISIPDGHEIASYTAAIDYE